MRRILALSLILCSVTSVAEKKQALTNDNLQPYLNSTQDYIRNLFRTTCELALKGEINANDPIDQSTKGLIANATQGMKKGTSSYDVIHNIVKLSATTGLSIKEKGSITTQNKTKIHTCNDALSYIEKIGFMSKIVAELGTSENSTSAKAGHNAPDDSVYRTTANALTAMYDENEVAADDKIGSRKVEVTGVVQSIDKDFTGSVVVLLQSGNEFMPARFGMENTEKAKASSLRKGQKATIICKKMRFLVGSASGSRCRFN